MHHLAEGWEQHPHDGGEDDLVRDAREPVRRRIGACVGQPEIAGYHHHRGLEGDEVRDLGAHHAETEAAERQNALQREYEARCVTGNGIEAGQAHQRGDEKLSEQRPYAETEQRQKNGNNGTE